MKLLSKQINGKRFRIIFNMYDSIKSCVSFNGDQSPFFSIVTKGSVRAKIYLLFLFAIFLNDIESFLSDNNCNGIDLTIRYEQITLFLKLFILSCVLGRYGHIWY